MAQDVARLLMVHGASPLHLPEAIQQKLNAWLRKSSRRRFSSECSRGCPQPDTDVSPHCRQPRSRASCEYPRGAPRTDEEAEQPRLSAPGTPPLPRGLLGNFRRSITRSAALAAAADSIWRALKGDEVAEAGAKGVAPSDAAEGGMP